MGMRVNIVDNPALRFRLGPVELAQGGIMPNPNRPAQPAPAPESTGQAAPTVATLGTAAAFPLDGRMNVPQTPLMADTIDQGTAAPENNAPPSVIEANAEANRAEQGPDGAPAPRISEFRFFVAAGSAQERQLETRLDLLEQRLETANNRLRYTDALSIQIDAQLDRARLEQDLETVSREIRRLRLEQVFARPSPEPVVVSETSQVEQPVQPVGTEPAPPKPAGANGLNLLA